MPQNQIIESLFGDLRRSLAQTAAPLFADQRPILIYGAGNVGKDVFHLLTSRGLPVVGFLDQQAKPESTWMGVPILKPDDQTVSFIPRNQVHVVIGIFNSFVEIPSILALLKSLGYDRVTTFLEFHDHFSQELGDRFWLTARSFYPDLEPHVSAAFDLWSDDSSRELYARILKYRFSRGNALLPPPGSHEQYFGKDLPPWPAPLRFVDCGAFDGDTLRQLAANKLPVQAIAAFEPDQMNFTKLARYLRTSGPPTPEVVCLFPCGVDASTSQVRFSSGQGTGSHASASGDTVIQCVSLDEALPTFRPNLIKMDIEGAEYAALRGARNLISEHRPGLAVCLYHRPGHLWQIPLLVHQLTQGGGRYFLRCHSLNGFELVLYWHPNG